MIDLMGTEPQKEVPIDHYHHVSRGLIERSLARLDFRYLRSRGLITWPLNYRRKAIGGGKAEIRNTAPGRSGSISRDRKGMDKGPYSRV